jgi:hypothetical protein
MLAKGDRVMVLGWYGGEPLVGEVTHFPDDRVAYVRTFRDNKAHTFAVAHLAQLPLPKEVHHD